MKRDLLPYQLIIGIVTIAVGGIAALMGELRDVYGFTNAQVGMIVAAGFLAAFLAQILFAPLADRGHARLMSAAGISLAVGSLVGMALVESFLAWIILRSILGFAAGLVLPGMRRAASVLDPDKVGENLGRLVMGEVIGFMIGPVIAGTLAALGSVTTPFVVMAALSAAFVPFAFRLPPDRGELDRTRRHSLDLLRGRRLAGVLFVVAAYFILIGAFESVIPIMLRDRGASTLTTGLAFALLGFPVAATAPVGGRLADRHGPVKVATAGIGFISATSAFYGFLPGIYPLILVMLFAGAADGIGFTAAQAAVSRAVVESRQAGALGLMGATEVGAAGVAAIPAAVLYDRLGDDLAWIIISLAAFVALVVGRMVLRGTTPVSVSSSEV